MAEDFWHLLIAEPLYWVGNLWQQITSEPLYLAIIGLVFDLVGAVLVAWTVWFRAESAVGWGEAKEEWVAVFYRRRWAMVIGGGFLAEGFFLQGLSTWLQIL